jgi:hypothetical protein
MRHRHLPEREIMTGIGPVAMRCPRVRDRVSEGSERIRISSAILPPYARRSKSLDVRSGAATRWLAWFERCPKETKTGMCAQACV